ncbi:PucR family transcriptional regulator [Neomicrococcus lactis]|uniref:PucR family transcriptional regulator n=1 Tax=Neomicrococcus lactis TaxID=732241 RepID=UPI002301F1E6|nr:PucR family transcriptional regulator [Neomicrococcus lactis]
MQTIASILALDTVMRGEPELLLGSERLNDPVRWVHVAGTRDLTGLLQGGELVLATAAIASPTAASARNFLEALAQEGAAALFVEAPDSRPEYDDAARLLQNAAAQVGVEFPVVQLHREVRFVEITQSVHELIVAEQFSKVERARQLHEEFMNLSVRGASQEDIVEAAARLVGEPVILEDRQHRVLSWSAKSDRALEPWTRHEPLEEVALELHWIRSDVGVGGHHWAQLVIPLQEATNHRDEEWASDAVLVLERAAQALTISRLAGRDERAVVQRARSAFLSDAATTAGLSAVRRRELNVRAQALGLGSAQRYLPGVVVLKEEIPQAAEHPSRRYAPGERQNQEIELIEHLYRTAAARRIPLLAATTTSGQVGVLVGLGAVAEGTAARMAEDQTLAELFASVDMTDLRIGVGDSAVEAVDAAAGLAAAAKVAHTAASLISPTHSFYRTVDLRLHGLLSQLAEDQRVADFVEAELGALLHPVDEPALELLTAFIEAGGNRSIVAREKFLSRPAVYARLARIEERLGVSLEDAASRTSLHVALLAREISDGRTSPS